MFAFKNCKSAGNQLYLQPPNSTQFMALAICPLLVFLNTISTIPSSTLGGFFYATRRLPFPFNTRVEWPESLAFGAIIKNRHRHPSRVTQQRKNRNSAYQRRLGDIVFALTRVNDRTHAYANETRFQNLIVGRQCPGEHSGWSVMKNSGEKSPVFGSRKVSMGT